MEAKNCLSVHTGRMGVGAVVSARRAVSRESVAAGGVTICTVIPYISNNAGSCQELFLYFLFSLFFFRHTTPFTPKSGLICSVKSLLRRPRLVRNLSVVFQSDPNISSIRTSTRITNSDSLRRERDAQSSGRRSTSRHVRYRAVPRTNRTLTTANTHIRSATSSTTQPPACAPSLP